MRPSTRSVPRAASDQLASTISSRVLSSGSIANDRSGSAGLLMSDTMNATWYSARSAAGLSKYARLAASMPYDPRPKYGMFT